jgi:hypothetical protein
MRFISLITQKEFNFKAAAVLFSALLIVFSISACGDKSQDSGEKKAAPKGYAGTLPAVGGDEPLPEGHPTMTDEKLFTQMPNQDHSQIKSTKPVKVSDSIKARYKSVNIQVADNSKGTKDVLKLDVGASKELADGFSIKVEIFLPYYSIYTDYIASKTDELGNPAIMVELYKDGKVVSSGWIFEEMPQYNSYRHLRYGVILLPTE